jgi:hypothetical protein
MTSATDSHACATRQAEEWRAVVGFEGQYEVSSLGRVRSIDRYQTYESVRGGKAVAVTRFLKGKLLRPGWTGSHLTVAIGKGNSQTVHHLMLEAFVGPRPPGHEGCHYDDDGRRNVLENLSWGTRSKNLHDAIRNGRQKVGTAKKNAKLSDEKVRDIRALLCTATDYQISKIFGVSDATIRQVRNGRTWKHVR